MIKSYKFAFNAESLEAPVCLDTGLCAVIPAWRKLNQTTIDSSILQELPPIDTARFQRLALVLHAYNPVPAFLKLVACTIDICRPSAIVVTTDSVKKQVILDDFLDQLPFTPLKVKTILLPNFGRDIVPFWHSIKEISGYSDVFLKLHWKDSPHLAKSCPQDDGQRSGYAWSSDIFKTLLPSSTSELEDILKLFEHNISCVYPRPWPPLSDIHWHSIANLEHFAQAMARLSFPGSLSLLPLIYPLGNMFYGSVSFFAQFADFFLQGIIPPSEPIGDDGTVLHATERIYTYLAATHGFDVAAIFPECPINSKGPPGIVLSGNRKIVVFPVSSLWNSSWQQSSQSLPVLHFLVMANSIRALLSSHVSLNSSSSSMAKDSPLSFAKKLVQGIHRTMSSLITLINNSLR